MKKVLYIIIPIIILLTLLLIIFIRPTAKDKEELKIIKSIKHFSFYYSQGYSINSDIRYYIDCNDTCIAKVKPYGIDNEDIKEVEVDNNFINKLVEILNKYEVIKWDGFDRVAKDVLDGDSFSLNLDANDDIRVNASGYMLWPDNYRIVREEINSLFSNIYEE